MVERNVADAPSLTTGVRYEMKSMGEKQKRVIGTTEDMILRAEAELGKLLPPSFKEWLIENNGLGIEDIRVYPVQDDRDVRKTWDSIVRNYRANWLAWLENFEGDERSFDHLLPFADFGTGDYYCFDLGRRSPQGENPVVRWSHETGDTEDRALSFREFAEKASTGDYSED